MRAAANVNLNTCYTIHKNEQTNRDGYLINCMVDFKNITDILLYSDKLNLEEYITVLLYFRKAPAHFNAELQEYLRIKHVAGCKTSPNDEIVLKVKIISDEFVSRLGFSKKLGGNAL